MHFKIDWVLINEIAIGPAPTKEHHFERIAAMGIGSILSLCSEKETNVLNTFKSKFNYKQYILPDHKIGVAPIIDEIEDCIQIIKKLKQKTSIYIHCLAGIERSPLICMAWLIKEHKLSMEESMEYMMQVHPNTNPHKEQLDLLKSI